MESLEARQLLSITLPTIANVTLPAGTTVFVPLAGSSDPGQTMNYSVTVSDYSKLTPVMMPADNQSLELKVKINGVDQTMDFQMLDNLAPNTTSSRSKGWFSPGFTARTKEPGDLPQCHASATNPPSSRAATTRLPEPSRRISRRWLRSSIPTSSSHRPAPGHGARPTTPSTSSTEFFITENGIQASRSYLDYNYTIFGIQTAGSSVVNTIAAMPDEDSTKDPSGLGYLQSPVTITRPRSSRTPRTACWNSVRPRELRARSRSR